MKNSLVSIAMCTYNGSKFIKEQLDSILEQSYNNFELIIVDDMSKDDTVDIINKYMQKDTRIKFFQNQKNLGFLKNFEKAMSFCSGEYIALADQDDIWKKNKLEVFLQEIKDNILIYSDAILIDENSKKLNKEFIRPESNLVKGKCNKSFIFNNCVSGNTLMFKKELMSYILPIPKKIRFHDIWIAFVASTIGTITYTEKSYTYYRRYDGQITKHIEKSYSSIVDKLKKKEKQYKERAKIIVDYCLEFRTIENLDEEIKNILDTIIEHNLNYEIGYFNIKMFKCLKKYKDELFSIKNIAKRNRNIRRYSVKNKLHKLLMYSL
ncbi:glycosyltransferase family 2 protein [Aliarcobacter skirrowii]|uniref:glycosyltransferase family 2 protein n=1 Tax=Aliarcobacter skirrowii TaxID=28200 RepID=UPI0029AA3503|nr:glycosyltransferase family 2 protein [Aliarcobacter skirrowii]MDX4062482.1 glycosyltransferase family 2 protein [Aliarcobacter skirrowii]